MSENKKVIYIVGMGPGSISGMSGDAVEALHKSDMIIGYTVYVDLVRQHFPDKEFKTTPMRQEIETLSHMFRLCHGRKAGSYDL